MTGRPVSTGGGLRQCNVIASEPVEQASQSKGAHDAPRRAFRLLITQQCLVITSTKTERRVSSTLVAYIYDQIPSLRAAFHAYEVSSHILRQTHL